ncbi:uncharacterized protein E0L32_010034 [Thyridium curvatum]|uniref:SMP-30/Gluconolactonase/LRE-like region domain-containing protein n=1 Tax=Thyridium curvatum TaxID=1093900 RepID=A0A507AMR1_9PEZI|nr:uncharacterized protein E0L32_010034 [Thyridium curvatum]TPX08547.1 hypothetical protein E0L32_010034 [Thyridium curvatum]
MASNGTPHPKELAHKPLADGMYFGESPRYHDGQLYISDMTGRTIYTIDAATGQKSVLVEVENQPNGMCFTDDGALIYSSMFDAKLYRYKDGEHALYSDMSAVMTGYCGDMAIDAAGRVYMDDTGARVLHGEPPKPGRMLLVGTDGKVSIAADSIIFPNACMISPDGRALYVGETFGCGLLRYDIDPATGALSNRQQAWAPSALTGKTDDDPRVSMIGIDGGCMDAEGGLWLSMLGLEQWVRLDPQGNVTHRIRTEGHATACSLGGEDGKTLFLVTNWVPEGENLFKAMVAKRTRCTVSTARVEIGRGAARP